MRINPVAVIAVNGAPNNFAWRQIFTVEELRAAGLEANSAFSPVMRSHEGNRPDQNLQIDGDPDGLAHFVAMTKVHARLAPYVAALCDEAAATGLPLQRPLFLGWEDDSDCWGVETQYGYGRDMIVAPVIEAGATGRPVYLPAGAVWIHLWSGERQCGRVDDRGPRAVRRAAGLLARGERPRRSVSLLRLLIQRYSGQTSDASRLSRSTAPTIPNAARASASGRWNTSSNRAIQ